MDWRAIGLEILTGGTKTILMITAILMPLMIGLELIKDARLLDRAAIVIRPVMRLFTLPQEGAFPLLAGVFFGISYGSGVILPFAQAGYFTRRDMALIAIFLAACHGMVEDTLIFTALGANWIILVLVRVCAAVFSMMLMGRVLRTKVLAAPAGPEAEESL